MIAVGVYMFLHACFILILNATLYMYILYKYTQSTLTAIQKTNRVIKSIKVMNSSIMATVQLNV